MDSGRLIIDEPARGSWNMAVDEALLLSTATTGRATLRFYQWSEPTLSLGYFQNVSSRANHPASQACPIVRRTTGGGAIVHDRELTYSFCAPITDRWSRDAPWLYQVFHESLVETLKAWRIDAHLWSDAAPAQACCGSFLCFQRRSVGDVVIGAQKVAGSAQRRHLGAVLQHGSVLLRRSNAAPELDGIEQLAQIKINVSELTNRWSEQLANRLTISMMPSGLERGETEETRRIERTKFTASRWTNKR